MELHEICHTRRRLAGELEVVLAHPVIAPLLVEFGHHREVVDDMLRQARRPKFFAPLRSWRKRRSGVARGAATVEQIGLKVAKPLRQPAVLVKRHHLVGAPDAVEDVHVARRGPGWWWRLDASDRGSEQHPAEGPRRGDGPERGEEHTPPDPHHRTTSR